MSAPTFDHHDPDYSEEEIQHHADMLWDAKKDAEAEHIQRNRDLIQELGQYGGVPQVKLDDMKSRVGGNGWKEQGKEFERLKIQSLINSPLYGRK